MFSITKEFRFEAAHSLSGLPAGHKCARVHGHSYAVAVTVSAADLVAPGFVTDFAELTPLGEHLKQTFDHQNLNDVLVGVEPTSENMARLLTDWCVENLALPTGVTAVAVTVNETPQSSAKYTRTLR